MKNIFYIIIVFFLSINLSAQNNTKHYLGGHAGSVSGLGFSYRYWPKKLGFQLTAIPIFQTEKRNFISAGISALYLLKEGRNIDLYSYLGFHYINRKSIDFYTDTYGNVVKQTNTQQITNTGIGLGFRFNLLQVLDLSLQGGYGFYKTNNSLYNFNLNYTLNFAGGVGLYYHL
jgi:hypothetical protein